MKKLLGITLFLLLLYGALLLANEGARTASNHANLAERIGLYGIISLGAGLLIITGGIDLSMGSVIGLCSTLLAMLLLEFQWPPLAAMAAGRTLPPGRVVTFEEIGDIVGVGDYLAVERDLAR